MFLPISIENKWSEEIEDGDISNHDSYVDKKKKIDDNQKKIQDEYYRHLNQKCLQTVQNKESSAKHD